MVCIVLQACADVISSNNPSVSGHKTDIIVEGKEVKVEAVEHCPHLRRQVITESSSATYTLSHLYGHNAFDNLQF